MRRSVTRPWTLALALLVLLTASCARSPEAQKKRHLESGARYLAQQQYQEAVIEYRNVLQLDRGNAQAIRGLALAHYQLGQLAPAVTYLRKAAELHPDDVDVRLKFGWIQLLGRRLDESRRAATHVLDKDPKSLDALLLFAESAATPGQIDEAIQRLEQARADLGTRPGFHLGLGRLRLRKRDTAGAEQAFREAARVEPKSVDAHLALGDLYMGSGDPGRAESELKRAAELSPPGSPARLTLAEFYFRVQKREEAERVLVDITEKAPAYLPAWRRRAESALAERKYDESLTLLGAVFKRNPADLDSRLIKGRVHLARGESAQAIQEFQSVLKVEPRFAPARFHLANAYLQGQNVQQARRELKEATTTSPSFIDARLLLARLDLQTGAVQSAITELEQVVAQHPQALPAHIMLANAYLAKRDPQKAIEVARKIETLAPKSPQGPYLAGMALLAQNQIAAAEKKFAAALTIAPDFIDPLAQLVRLDLARKLPGAAVTRVTEQVRIAPGSAALQVLLGDVYRTTGERDRAETAYRRALELEPRQVAPYRALAQLYAASGKDRDALAQLTRMLELNPRDLVGLTLAGSLHERQNDLASAEEAYRRALAINPRFAPAANNLAYHYSRTGKNKDEALRLAQLAKEEAPDEPHISDTLGWILYQRGLYRDALDHLRYSAAKLTGDPQVAYHLGMAAYKAGDRETARQALGQALANPRPFDGKDEAQRTLAGL